MASDISPRLDTPAPPSSPALKRAATSNSSERPARRRAVEACESCRARKTKCDGARPLCFACRASARKCTYTGNAIESHAITLFNDAEQWNRLHARIDQLESHLLSQKSPSAAHPTIPTAQHPMLDPLSYTYPFNFSIPGFGASPTDIFRKPSSQRSRMLAVPSLMALCTKLATGMTESFEDSTTPSSIPPVPIEERTEMESCLGLELSTSESWCANYSVGRKARFSDNDVFRLQEAYFIHVNAWLPLLEKGSTWLPHFHQVEASGFQEHDMSTALVLLTFALGAIAGSEPASPFLPGHDYFLQAMSILGIHSLRNDLTVAQCYVLAAEYCLLAQQPLPAFDAVTTASRKLLILQKCGVSQRLDTRSFAGAFWCAAILETELNIHLQMEGSGIARCMSLIPISMLGSSDNDLMFFLAQIQLKKMKYDITDALQEGDKLREGTINIAEKLRECNEEWYRHLPASLQFSLEPGRLFDDRRVFLRMQFYCTQAMVASPAMADIIHAANETEVSAMLRDPRVHEMVTLYIDNLVFFAKGFKEQMSRRTIVTWLMTQAAFIMLLRIIIVSRVPALVSYLPSDWQSLLRETIDHLLPWTSSPSTRLCHRLLHQWLDEPVATADGERLLNSNFYSLL